MKNGRKLIESQEPDYGALAGITADDWAVMISGGDLTEAAMGQQLARQARTIRRLRALADGYRDGLDDAIAKSKFVGARFERARIVAWLRGDCVHRDMGCDCHVIADAIERGEL